MDYYYSSGFLLWQVTVTWQRQINAALRTHGLTQIQFVLLAGILWLSTKEKFITQIMLARHTKADVMTTSQVLRTLEEKGFVARKSHPTDTRANVLHLTAAGKKIVFAAIPDVDKVDESFFKKIGSKKHQFNEVLRSLALID